LEKEASYWEKRSYQRSLGAENDAIEYNCFSLLKIKKSIYDRAVELSIEKMLREIGVSASENGQTQNEIKERVLDAE
jgi:hypothetical protein